MQSSDLSWRAFDQRRLRLNAPIKPTDERAPVTVAVSRVDRRRLRIVVRGRRRRPRPRHGADRQPGDGADRPGPRAPGRSRPPRRHARDARCARHPGEQGRARGRARSRPPKRRAQRRPTFAAPNPRLVLARATHDRMAELQAKRSATAQELDQAVAALAAAEAQRASAQARLAAANAARDAAQASADAADDRRDLRRARRRRSTGSSPSAAPIRARWRRPARRSSRWRIPRRSGSRSSSTRRAPRSSRPGRPSRSGSTTHQQRGDGWIDGRVAEIARVDPASHSFLVKIDLPASAALRSGLFGRARFAGPARRALTVPASALVRRGQLTFVFVVDAERPRPAAADLDRARQTTIASKSSPGFATAMPS